MSRPTQSSDDAALWDAEDVARYFKASRSWAYQQAEAGNIPSLRIGGLRRFEPEAVKAYARGGKLPPSKVVPIRGDGR
jgi:excisionase family DNA binding protein